MIFYPSKVITSPMGAGLNGTAMHAFSAPWYPDVITKADQVNTKKKILNPSEHFFISKEPSLKNSTTRIMGSHLPVNLDHLKSFKRTAHARKVANRESQTSYSKGTVMFIHVGSGSGLFTYTFQQVILFERYSFEN